MNAIKLIQRMTISEVPGRVRTRMLENAGPVLLPRFARFYAALCALDRSRRAMCEAISEGKPANNEAVAFDNARQAFELAKAELEGA